MLYCVLFYLTLIGYAKSNSGIVEIDGSGTSNHAPFMWRVREKPVTVGLFSCLIYALCLLYCKACSVVADSDRSCSAAVTQYVCFNVQPSYNIAVYTMC